MHQGRGLERLAGRLLSEFLGRQLAQLIVNQREELRGGVGIAFFDGGQDTGNLVHWRHRTLKEPDGGQFCVSDPAERDPVSICDHTYVVSIVER